MNRRGDKNKPSRWKDLETLLGSKLPALPTNEQLDLLKNTSWVEDYVQTMLEKSLPKAGMIQSLRSKSEVFETHNHVIVRTPVSYETNPVVKVRTDLVKIEGMFDSKKHQLIRLPSLVIPSTARATYKGGILQVKIRKKKLSKAFHEVSVRYI